MSRLLYIVVIVAFLDTFIQLPIITPYSLELGATYALAGAIVAVYSLTNMIGNIVGGHWIDKFGRKKMLLTGMVVVAIIRSEDHTSELQSRGHLVCRLLLQNRI